MLRWNAGALVLDRQQGRTVSARRRETDRGPWRRVDEGVLDQDAPDLQDALLVTQRRDLHLPAVDSEMVVGRQSHGVEFLGQGLCQRAEIDPLSFDRQAARIQTREVEKLRGELRQPLDLLP